MDPENNFNSTFYGKSPYVIAEIGTSHGGSLSKAEELIIAAKESGADAAKFQIVYANEIVHPFVGQINLPGGSTNIYEAFKKVEQTPDFFFKINELCNHYQIEFMASAFGSRSLQELASLKPRFFKLASPELNYYPFIQEINQTPMRVILSTGVSTTADIKNALKAIEMPAAVLHCVTTYPTPETACNLRWLQKLAKIAQIPVGWSDHTEDPLAAPLTALYYGASVIEKHIRLSDSTDGLDDSFALSPKQFKTMTHGLRYATLLSHSELKEQLLSELGKERFLTLSGHAYHRLTAHEKTIYKTTNRSWMALSDIPIGTYFTPNNSACLRCEGNHIPGIRPTLQSPSIWGTQAKKDYLAGEGIH